ncbi:hypothetical protein ACYJW8_00260 [Frateuria aurantia]
MQSWSRGRGWMQRQAGAVWPACLYLLLEQLIVAGVCREGGVAEMARGHVRVTGSG